MTEEVPVLPWATFLPWFVSRWEQGQHVSIVGTTGCGKSVLAHELLEARTAASSSWHTAVLANKPRDATLDAMVKNGWHRISSWPPPRSHKGKPVRRVLLWPKLRTEGDPFVGQAGVFDQALRAIFTGGRWAVYCDEVRYLTKSLGLQQLVELFWLQGRSIGITVVASTQRAAWVPLEFYSQARYLFLFHEASPANRKRLVEHCGGANGAQVAQLASVLGPHEFLMVDTWDGTLVRSKVER